MIKVHISRIGSVVIMCLCFIVPSHLRLVASDECLVAYMQTAHDDTAAHRRTSGEQVYDWGDKSGLTIEGGIAVTTLIVMLSYFIGLFSIDTDRLRTYKEIEEAAVENRAINFTPMRAPSKSIGEFTAGQGLMLRTSLLTTDQESFLDA